MNYLFTKVNNKHQLLSMQTQPTSGPCVNINGEKFYFKLYPVSAKNALPVRCKIKNTISAFGYSHTGVVLINPYYTNYKQFDEYIDSYIDGGKDYSRIQYFKEYGVYCATNVFYKKVGMTPNVYDYTEFAYSEDGFDWTHIRLDDKGVFGNAAAGITVQLRPQKIYSAGKDTVIIAMYGKHYSGNDLYYSYFFYKIDNFRTSPVFSILHYAYEYKFHSGDSGDEVTFLEQGRSLTYYIYKSKLYQLNLINGSSVMFNYKVGYDSVYYDKKKKIFEIFDETNKKYRLIYLDTGGAGSERDTATLSSLVYIDSEKDQRDFFVDGFIGEYYVVCAKKHNDLYEDIERYYFLTKDYNEILNAKSLSTTDPRKVIGRPIFYNPIKKVYYFRRFYPDENYLDKIVRKLYRSYDLKSYEKVDTDACAMLEVASVFGDNMDLRAR